ncbi:Methyltransferases [Theobroma cacao]|uniref:Methyltransferases n=1 Tax=Theobroma cacao TaxID=3641 RepID=A0A061ERP9_THECC|nr:Methyltransferases [Theobroma cacao]
MEPTSGKPSLLRNILARALLFGVIVIVVRFAYVVTITGESCNIGDFCFFSLPQNLNFVIPGSGAGVSAVIGNDAVPRSNPRRDLYTSKEWIKAVHFYSSIFQDLISEGYLTPHSKSLCVETPSGQDVFALKEIGVEDSVGIFKKAAKPLVIKGEGHLIPFDDNTFDFIFSGGARLDVSARPSEFASEIARTLKPEGFALVHIQANDTYSFNSFLDLFNSCKLVKMHEIDGFDSSMPYIREIVLKKEFEILHHGDRKMPDGNSYNKCSVPGHKRELVQKAEPLIEEEPLKPWITLKRNINNIKYLPSMVDISFKNRYVYVDVGARSYGSSIGSWFRKQYPKQNKTFHVYAIEADKHFHKQYELKKKRVTLLPYAAWVRNESLSFEINGDPGQEEVNELKDKGRGMGRIQPVKSRQGEFTGEVDEIQGFDFAEWLKNTVTERDFVVMKMDVEGTEFDLIPRLFETGAICLIDEIFLECHYNRWQRCCPGQRSTKYEKNYGQCLELFTSLRKSGVLVHQWW